MRRDGDDWPSSTSPQHVYHERNPHPRLRTVRGNADDNTTVSIANCFSQYTNVPYLGPVQSRLPHGRIKPSTWERPPNMNDGQTNLDRPLRASLFPAVHGCDQSHRKKQWQRRRISWGDTLSERHNRERTPKHGTCKQMMRQQRRDELKKKSKKNIGCLSRTTANMPNSPASSAPKICSNSTGRVVSHSRMVPCFCFFTAATEGDGPDDDGCSNNPSIDSSSVGLSALLSDRFRRLLPCIQPLTPPMSPMA